MSRRSITVWEHERGGFAGDPLTGRSEPIVLSHGGGVDSEGLMRAGVARGELQAGDYVVHMDVGHPLDPGEWPGTLRWLREHTLPFCEEHGLRFVLITGEMYPIRPDADGRGARSLIRYFEGYRGGDEPTARVTLPMTDGAKRHCTRVAKVERFERWLDDTFPGREVEVWLGFEAGEESRAKADPNAGLARKPSPTRAVRRNRFPLIEWRMCRCRCAALIREQVGAVPRKSACVFCVYGTKADWQTFATELPAQFARVVALEAAKLPTDGRGIKLSIMGYESDKLTRSAHAALSAWDRDPYAKVHGGTRKALLKRELVVRVEGGGPNAGKVGHLLTPAGIAALRGGPGFMLGYKAPPLPEWIQGEYEPKVIACDVCGAPERATKAVGCGYLEEGPDVGVGSLTRQVAS